MTTIPVNVSRKYDVLIEKGLLHHIGEKIKKTEKVAIITDTNVEKLYIDVVKSSLNNAGFNTISYAFKAGEASKNGNTYLTLLSWLAENKLTRSDIIIALGGGVVGDMAGFVAATYLRGTPFVQVPTTLLAMVDSSVGGKTAIDINEGKNLVGAFNQPALVVCDPNVLKTLSEETFHDGLAEVIKHGMIRSATLLDKLTKPHNIEEIIAENIIIKRDIVQNDEFDTGERMLLNFGHTIGHAIEKLSHYKIPHGNAVAIGMTIITRAAVDKNECPPECLKILTQLLQKYNLPTKTEYKPNAIFEAALTDKKRMGEMITEVIPTAIGNCKLKKMPVDELLSWIEIGAI